MPRYNPFKPGSIVNPGMFAGRGAEVLTLERVLFQTKNGNPDHFLIQGERGIGKSSLLLYLQSIATGQLNSIQSGSFRFLTVSLELEPANTYLEIIQKLGAELKRTAAVQQQAKELFKSAWEFLSRWEVNVAGVGVKYSKGPCEIRPQDLLDELTYTVERTVSDMGTAMDGIVILIDEADKPTHSAHLGKFVKLFTERLTKRGCNRVCIGMAGLPVLLKRLQMSHESSPRIFQILTLEPLLSEGRIKVIQFGLDEAKTKTEREVTITPEAADWISMFSEGYPQFIQQFAYSAYEADTDNVIDVQDAMKGAFEENGAFKQLGLKYFQELYFDQIGSDEYREVLRAMSNHLDGWVNKEEIRQFAKIKESTLNNALAALKKRHIIIAKEGKKGVYSLPSKSFAVWIRGYTEGLARNRLGQGDVKSGLINK